MEIHNNFNLKDYNSYKIKSTCKTAFFPDCENELIELFNRSKDYVIIGNGNNVILSKESYDEEFIIFNGNMNKIHIYDNIIEAECGVLMEELSIIASEKGLSGLEIFYDIPSSLGGAVVMNAGASGEEIKDVLKRVRFLDLVDMKVKEITSNDIEFEYRNSYFQKNKNKIVLKAWLELISRDKILIEKKMYEIKTKRHEKQPREYPNCGSVFKRPEGKFVGPMIEELGLKGYSIGGAMVSEKHAGFIINKGNATGKDILLLIKTIQDKVKEVFNINLVVEQRII